MPDSETLSSEIAILPSFSLPIWSSSSSAAASKRGGAPRASPIWSATSTLPRAAFAASNSLLLTAAAARCRTSVTRTTSRSADQTKGVASGTRRVSSLTRRTPGTVSTAASAARRPSGENASAAKVTSRPATVTRFLSRIASLTAAFDARGNIALDRLSARPGGESPKDDQQNSAWPPFAAPPVKVRAFEFPRLTGTERKQTLAGLSNPK